MSHFYAYLVTHFYTFVMGFAVLRVFGSSWNNNALIFNTMTLFLKKKYR